MQINVKYMEEYLTGRAWIIVGLVALVSVFHYGTPIYRPFSHELFSRFYYIPVILGGFWFGLRGGLVVSLFVTLVYMPHLWKGWGQGGILFWDKLLEVFLFNLAGATVGVLVDRERRQRARNQELQTLAILGEAAASVAHEMKNVIIPIRGFIRRIRKTCPPNGKAESYLEIVERESVRLENMAKNMLAFARQAPLQKEEVDVGVLLEEIHKGLKEEFKEHAVRFLCQCGQEAARVSMDREKIRQALVNLLQNSLHASPEGAVVRLFARRNQRYLQFVVEDEGEGIPQYHLDRIYLPFFTTKSKGTGLGLAIVARIVDEHGGEILVQSSPGKGTQFCLEIPFA